MKCDICNGVGSIVLCYDRLSHSSIVCGKCSGTGKMLNRREKYMNEMPELKAGMIVEYTSREFGELGLYLYINDSWGLGLFENSKQSLSGNVSVSKIFNIGEHKSSNYNGLKSKLKLIWPVKSDKDIKQDEILKQIDDLKQEHSKFMDNAEKISNDIDELKTKMETLNE